MTETHGPMLTVNPSDLPTLETKRSVIAFMSRVQVDDLRLRGDESCPAGSVRYSCQCSPQAFTEFSMMQMLHWITQAEQSMSEVAARPDFQEMVNQALDAHEAEIGAALNEDVRAAIGSVLMEVLTNGGSIENVVISRLTPEEMMAEALGSSEPVSPTRH